MDQVLAIHNCEGCGKQFNPRRRSQKYDSAKCRFDAANRQKSAQRKVDASTRACSVPECDYRSPLGRFYRHTADGRTVVLCGLHHAERYRPERSDGEVTLVTGGYYYGYFHHSIYDLTKEPLYDDGGLGQLIDHLSGEVDLDGLPIPHPLVSRQIEVTIYAPRSV